MQADSGHKTQTGDFQGSQGRIFRQPAPGRVPGVARIGRLEEASSLRRKNSLAKWLYFKRIAIQTVQSGIDIFPLEAIVVGAQKALAQRYGVHESVVGWMKHGFRSECLCVVWFATGYYAN